MGLTLTLNGQRRVFDALAETPSLDDLVVELGLKADRVAVEHNGQIVARPDWTSTRLHQEDRLEIVHFVGGGASEFPSEILMAGRASAR